MTETLLSPLLNNELIKRALQCYHNVNEACALEIKACDYKLSSASGENFCSEIYQVDVQYEWNGNALVKSLIVKIMIPEIAEMGSNEQLMFNTVLPLMESCLKFVDGNNENKLHAKCLLSERQKDEFYVLENLNSLDYYCADRTKGLDLAQALILMAKIAKFHAASMILVKKYPTAIESLKGSHFENGATDNISQVIAFGGFAYVAKMIENWSSYKHLSKSVYSILRTFNSLVIEAVNPKNSKFNVINHGDLWVNNFLFKYDEDSGKPLDVLFVDFQNSFWGSCGFDINWFLNTSLELKVLKENRKQLIQSYYDSLKLTLSNESFPTQEIPTLENVFMEIKHCEIVGLYTSLCELPIIALEKCQGFDSNTFIQPKEMKKMREVMYKNPRVLETLKYTLKYFNEINIL